MRISIRWKILVLLLLPLAGFCLALLGYSFYTTHDWTVRTEKERMTALIQDCANRIDETLLRAELVAETTASFVGNDPGLTPMQLDNLLKSNLRHVRALSGSAVFFAPYAHDPKVRLFVRRVYRDGNELREEDSVYTGYDYTDPQQENWHGPRRTGRPAWTDPYFGGDKGNVLFTTFSAPFFRNKKFAGLVTVDLPLETLGRMADIGVPADFRFSIVTKNGNYIYSPQGDRVDQSLFEAAVEYDPQSRMEIARSMAQGKSGFLKLLRAGTEQWDWVFFTVVPSTGWFLLVAVDETATLLPVGNAIRTDIIFLTVVLVLLALGVWFLAARVSRPLAQLNGVLDDMAAGNMKADTGIRRRDEIGALALSCNRLAEHIKPARRGPEAKRRALQGRRRRHAPASLPVSVRRRNYIRKRGLLPVFR